MDTQVGTPFNTTTYRQDRTRLLKLGYLVDIGAPQIEPGSSPGKIRLTIPVVDQKLGFSDIGLEWSSGRFLGFTQLTWNHFLIPSGKLSTKTQISLESHLFEVKSYRLTYLHPWLFNWVPIASGIEGWQEFNRELLGNTIVPNQRTGQAANISVPLIRDWLSVSIKAKNEVISPTTVSFQSYVKRSGVFQVYLSSFQALPEAPLSASFFGEIENGGQLLGLSLGGLVYNRIYVSASEFLSLTPTLTLAFRQAGGAFSPNDQNILTFESEGFLLGGAASLRGYGESQFSDHREILTNFEVRQIISPSFQAVLFIDAGTVFGNLVSPSFQVGKGFGIRLFTPIGPLRFDFAWGDTFRIHFGLGQVF